MYLYFVPSGPGIIRWDDGFDGIFAFAPKKLGNRKLNNEKYSNGLTSRFQCRL